MHKPESRDAVDQKFFCLTEIQVCTMTKRLQLDYMLCDDIPMLIGFDMQTNREMQYYTFFMCASGTLPHPFFYNYNFSSYCSKRLNVPITKTSLTSSKQVHYISRAQEAFSENVSMERRTMLPKLEVN